MIAVLAFGALFVYLLGLLPAIVVCVRKRQWAMLFAGFLTLGLVWWIGAAVGESRRTLGIVATGLLCAVLALGVVGARPGQFVGVDGHSLSRAVEGHWLVTGDGCEHLSGADWKCERWSNSESGYIAYRVHVSPLGCWRGVEEARQGTSDPYRIGGCVHLEDYLL